MRTVVDYMPMVGHPKLKFTMMKPPTTSGAFILAGTPFLTEVSSNVGEYTDAQFYADLKKASNWLDAMEAEALKEDAEGKTREFPV